MWTPISREQAEKMTRDSFNIDVNMITVDCGVIQNGQVTYLKRLRVVCSNTLLSSTSKSGD